MRPIFIPERASALRADWAPGPGVLVLFPPVALSFMWRALMPSSCHFKKYYEDDKGIKVFSETIKRK